MRRNRFPFAAAALVLGSSVVTPQAARAGDRAPEVPGDRGAAGTTASAVLSAPPNPRIVGLEGAIGVRGSRITSPGFDAFSSDDGLAASTLGASYWFLRTPTLGAAAGVEWSHATATSHLRGTRSGLDTDGLALTLKASVPLSRRWAAFARLAPGVVRLDARLHEESSPIPSSGTYPLTQTKWLPSIDVTAGAAFCVASLSRRRPGALTFRYWLTAEGGYGYSPSYELALGGAPPTAAGRTDQPVSLGTLSMRGGFVRAGVAMTF